MIIGIYGTGGTARDVYDIVLRQNRYEQIIFIDDTKKVGKFRDRERYPFDGIPNHYNPQNMKIVIAVGEPSVRKKLYDKVKKQGYMLVSVIHEDVEISRYAIVGEGVIALRGVVIGADACLKENILLEPYVIVGHDVYIGKHTVLSGQVAIGGYARLNEAVYIALASVVKDRVEIGNETIVGVGSMVVKDIPEDVIAVGYPARVIKKNVTKKVF